MCGIVAASTDVPAEECERMLERLAHRGPDNSGRRHVGPYWLGHRRLSIVDLEMGQQPLHNEDESLWLVGNGEIYNHLELRSKLSTHNYATSSDNEAILHLLEEYGVEGITQLRGMFAFVAAGPDGSLIAARDALGIKPLYWVRTGETILFSSEMKAFDKRWHPYIEAFPPGHYFTKEQGLQSFTELPVPEVSATSTKASRFRAEPNPSAMELQKLRETLIAAVRRRMMADVPVGVFLSGGLDSSLISAIASRIAAEEGRQIKSFSVGLKGSPDLVAAREVAEFLGTDHYEWVYTPEAAVAIVPEVVRMMESFDPSLVESAVANYMIAELTARHVKVVLTGEGADELFAGYKYHKGISDEEELHRELIRTVKELHHLNLQRCDRMTMAHSLEARVPFLDVDVIQLALRMPVEWKLHGENQVEKWVLRKAFEGYLPDAILWRKKSQFNEGSGMDSVLRDALASTVSEEDFRKNRNELDPPLTTQEEMAYYRVFRETFSEVEIESVLGRSPAAFAVE
ncbi:asparagine synthase B [Alicyclobacillus sp. SO9]|uniref:asparagine synthase B n=1 Tax=Alicyclobacillus sp. SO9 TaxID=2665646 RepID=UPI0018E745B4|nr:asparagine synthase B [Alicyclobacillus sp. SO9]QQE79868.1 asparagine synthase B [Alicyclobacillus sp. SO9]